MHEAGFVSSLSEDGGTKTKQLAIAALILALSVPVGFVIAHLVTPFLWWMELRTSMALTAQSGPRLFVIALSTLFVWGVLYAATCVVLEQRRR